VYAVSPPSTFCVTAPSWHN